MSVKKKIEKEPFYIEMLLFVEMRSAQIIFVNPLCNKWTRVVWKTSSRHFKGEIKKEEKKKTNVLFFLSLKMWLKVKPRDSTRSVNRLWHQSDFIFSFPPAPVSMSVRRVRWRRRGGGRSHRRPPVSMPSLLLPVYVQCFLGHAFFSTYTWCCRTFSSPKIKAKHEKNHGSCLY